MCHYAIIRVINYILHLYLLFCYFIIILIRLISKQAHGHMD